MTQSKGEEDEEDDDEEDGDEEEEKVPQKPETLPAPATTTTTTIDGMKPETNKTTMQESAEKKNFSTVFPLKEQPEVDANKAAEKKSAERDEADDAADVFDELAQPLLANDEKSTPKEAPLPLKKEKKKDDLESAFPPEATAPEVSGNSTEIPKEGFEVAKGAKKELEELMEARGAVNEDLNEDHEDLNEDHEDLNEDHDDLNEDQDVEDPKKQGLVGDKFEDFSPGKAGPGAVGGVIHQPPPTQEHQAHPAIIEKAKSDTKESQAPGGGSSKCLERLAEAGESLRAKEDVIAEDHSIFKALQAEAAQVRLLPGFPADLADEGDGESVGLLATFRKLRRMAMMEVAGEASGSALLQASKAAEDPVASLAAYGGILMLVCFTACCLGRWQTMRRLFQMQVALLNAMWGGIWLNFGIVGVFSGRNPVMLVHREIYHGFTLLLMSLYVYVAACNCFMLAFQKGAFQKLAAFVSIVIGAALYWMLFTIGKSDHIVTNSSQTPEVLTSYSYAIYFGFSFVFGIMAISSLSLVASLLPPEKKGKSVLAKFKGSKKGPAVSAEETEMFVISAEEED